MKLKQIEVQRTYNLGNYENIKLTATYDVGERDGLTDAMQAARIALDDTFAAMYRGANIPAQTTNDKPAEQQQNVQQQNAQQQVETPKKPIVTNGSKLLQRIVDRIVAKTDGKGAPLAPVTMEQILENYELAEDAEKIIRTALYLNAD